MQIKIIELTGQISVDEAVLSEACKTMRLVSVIWDSYKMKALAYLEGETIEVAGSPITGEIPEMPAATNQEAALAALNESRKPVNTPPKHKHKNKNR